MNKIPANGGDRLAVETALAHLALHALEAVRHAQDGHETHEQGSGAFRNFVGRWTNMLPGIAIRAAQFKGENEPTAAEVQQRRAETGQLAREPFNVDDDAGGKSGLRARLEALPQGRVFGRRKIGGAICSHDLPWRIESRGDEIVAESLGRQQDDLRADDVSIR